MSCPSSFNGVITEIPCIRVDNFEVDKFHFQDIKAYFLSHYHQDHVVGLHTPKFLEAIKQTEAIIYCTELTKIFIEDDLKYKELIKYVKPLQLGSSLLTLPIDEINEVLLTVTLIPAGHCAGSAMFLFKTSDTTVLYTGDFRVNKDDLSKYKALHLNGEPIKIDTLYIDTTFLGEKYEYFPKRSETVDMILSVIIDWLKDGDGGVSIHPSAKYGFEYVFNEIYRNLNVKVYVDSSRWKLYSKIQHLVPGVTNSEEEKQIHLCSPAFPYKECVHITDFSYRKCLQVRLTARRWEDVSGPKDIVQMDTRSSNITNLYVCFSTHCSASEILYFKNYFKINTVVGFPNKFKDFRSQNKSKVNEHLLKLLLH